MREHTALLTEKRMELDSKIRTAVESENIFELRNIVEGLNKESSAYKSARELLDSMIEKQAKFLKNLEIEVVETINGGKEADVEAVLNKIQKIGTLYNQLMLKREELKKNKRQPSISIGKNSPGSGVR